MSESYRIFGAELSPYSVKVRSYFRYKNIPHEWVLRSGDNAEEYQKYAKIPIVPLLVSSSGEALQDSTPMMEAIEARYPDPSVHPEEPVSQFMSYLLEEFGDEWGNKWMFHLRWAREEDCLSAAGRIAGMNAPGGDESARLAIRAQVIERMKGRVFFVGSNETTAPQIEQSFRDALALLDTHLADRPYLFGERPSFADFGIWGQVYNAWTDPTGAAWVEAAGTHVLAWIHRMLNPQNLGPFEAWSALAPTLTPLIAQQCGDLFLPWSVANAEAMAAGEEEFSVTLNGQTFTQQPQKYHMKSLAVLRAKYAAVADNASLAKALEECGCLAPLAP